MAGNSFKILIGILYVCFLFSSTELRANPACKSPFAKISASVVSGYFKLFPQTSVWLHAPKREPETEALVQSLIALTLDERSHKLEHLKRYPPADPKLLRIMRLALYDEAEWNQFYAEFTSRPLLDDSLVNSLVPVLRHMPADLAKNLHEKIRGIYPKLSKMNFRILPPKWDLRLAPKRSVDAFLFHTLKIDDFLAERSEAGISPQQGLQDYFDLIQKTIFQGTEFGGYPATEVIRIGETIQKILNENASENADKDPFILIGGSLPNGRAKIGGSFDLDCQLSDQNLIQLFPKINQRVTAELAQKYPKAKVTAHVMRSSTTPHFAAQVSPVFLKITKNRIEYVVYPPTRPLHQDKRLQPYNYPRPRSYLLSGETGKSDEEDPRIPFQRKTKLPTLTVEEIKKILSSGFKTKSSWMKSPMKDPQTDALIFSLIALTPKERAEIGAYLQNNPTQDKNRQRALNLALFDPDAWQGYVKQLCVQPQDNDAIYNALVPVILAMPETLKEELVSQVRTLYPKARREKYVWRFPFLGRTYLTIGPKRSMDALLANLTNPRHFFEKQIAEGATPLIAYESYLKMMKEKVFKDLPKGNYQAQDVLTIAAEIQKSLQTHSRNLGETVSATIAGSLPMGRSAFDGSSDVDLILSNHKLKDLMPEMETRIKSALGPKYGETHLEVHSMFSTTTDINAALVSPIMIHITPDRIEIQVHPRILPLHNDINYLSENYPEPDVYHLN